MVKIKRKNTIVVVLIVFLLIICTLLSMVGIAWRYKANCYQKYIAPFIDVCYDVCFSLEDYVAESKVKGDDFLVEVCIGIPLVLGDSIVRDMIHIRNFSEKDLTWIKGKDANVIVEKFGYYDYGMSVSGKYIPDGSATESELSYIIYTLSPGSLLKSWLHDNYEYEYDLLLKIEFGADGLAKNTAIYRDIPRT